MGQLSDQIAFIAQKMATFGPGFQPSSRRPSYPITEDIVPDNSTQSDGQSGPSLGSGGDETPANKEALVATQRPTTVREQFLDAKGQQCVVWCSCKCHAKQSFRSPWLISCFIGEFRIQYDGARPQCNERKCVRSSSVSYHLTYRFPRYLLDRYLLTTAHFHPTDGPRFSLRMPRVMPWSHMLWYYANTQQTEGIQNLFSEGKASPFDLNLQGASALMYAAEHSDTAMCQFLIQQGADPEAPDESGKPPSRIMWENSFAGQYGVEGISIVGSMLQNADFAETRQFSTIHKIVLGIFFDSLESELERSTAIIDQADARGRTPLCWAVIRNDSSAVKTLLAYNANPNAFDEVGHSPLDFVRSAQVCQALVDAGVDIHHRSTVRQRSALHRLCTGPATVEVLDMLVKAGIPVDDRDTDDETPLLNAIYNGRHAVVRRLIELGADINATNKSSQENAVHFAVSFDRYQILPLLLKAGADYQSCNKHGRNILHLAARFAGTKTLEALSEWKLSGLHPETRDDEKKTAAEYMAERAIFSDREMGLHAQFNTLLESLETTTSSPGIEQSLGKGDNNNSDHAALLPLTSSSPLSVSEGEDKEEEGDGDFKLPRRESELTDVESLLDSTDRCVLPGAFPP